VLCAIFSLFSLISLVSVPAFAQVALDDEFAKEPSWKSPAASEVRTQVIAWLDNLKPEETVRKQVVALWPEASDSAADAADSKPILERVVATFAKVDPAFKQIADVCSKPHGLSKTPEFPALADEKTPAFVRNNLRLFVGRWLAQERLYDEALAQLKDLQPTDVVDPAALLFYQGVCHHWMLHKDDGLKTIAKLLEQRKTIPRRYAQVAELMQTDLTALEDDSLDHISRRMNDVTRRLDYGHAGKHVRGVEDGIIASLDKLIKDLEDRASASSSSSSEQQQSGDPQGRQGRNPGDPEGIRSRNPASESRLARGKGAGDVKSKNIGNHSGWGDLPAKDREEAMQQIGKEFPSHYRDIIEQYFRKLASDEEEK
jgi:hypothetical protein